MSNPLDDVPEGEPTALVAGDTWVWKRSDLASDYPVADYALSYALKREGSTEAPTLVAATAFGDDYQVTVAAAATAELAAGTWRWDAFMTRSADLARVRIAYGRLVVSANLAVSTADPRSHARKMLEAIEALLEGRSVKDVNSYSIKDRSLTKMTAEELTSWRTYYLREVHDERVADLARQGRPTGRYTFARFDS